jgi:hypothetical protein
VIRVNADVRKRAGQHKLIVTSPPEVAVHLPEMPREALAVDRFVQNRKMAAARTGYRPQP